MPQRNIHGHALSENINTNRNAGYHSAAPQTSTTSKLCSCFRRKNAGHVADWQPSPARRVPSGGAHRDPLLPPPEDPTKKCLVLDLDETLVHSSFQAVRADAGVSFFTIPVEIEHSVHDINVIRRPGLDEFLRRVGSIYEVVIFTASLAKYANPVVDTIDTSRVVKHRLFREHCVFAEGNYVKDLSMLGRDLKSTIIIDNSAVSYQFQPENAIPCSNFIDDPNDTDLYELVPLLEALEGVADVTRALAKQ